MTKDNSLNNVEETNFLTTQINRREFLKGLVALPLITLQMSPTGRVLHGLSADGNKPNVLILVFDTFSALHTSINGYGRETTPNLARFAAGANVYHNHYAGGSFTTPGTASLLSGTYPWTHRALHLYGKVADELAGHNLFAAFDDSYYKIAYTHNPVVSNLLNQFRSGIDHWKRIKELCLRDLRYSELLFDHDYIAASTAEFHTRQDSNIPGSLFLSILDGVQRVVTRNILVTQYGANYPRGLPSYVNSFYFLLEDVFDWLLAELPKLPQPYLAYIHVLPPHSPYTPRREFVDLFAGDGLTVMEKAQHFASTGEVQASLDEFRRHYDEYIAHTDAEFGRFYEQLQKRSLLDNTLMAVTSDHGELFERGIYGHITPALYQPLTRVPLLIKRPGQLNRQDITVPTSCVDVLPTIMAETGQAVPHWCEGEILPGFSGSSVRAERPVFSVDAKSNPKLAPLNKATIAMMQGEYKLIWNRGYEESTESYELYNLAQDPEELENLYTIEKEVSQAMSAEMARIFSAHDRE